MLINVDFINSIEKITGIEVEKEMLPMQAGDVNQTWADVSQLQKDYDYKSRTSVDSGIEAFINWYKSYFNKN